jgi:Tfp pilus assembly protein PilF
MPQQNRRPGATDRSQHHGRCASRVQMLLTGLLMAWPTLGDASEQLAASPAAPATAPATAPEPSIQQQLSQVQACEDAGDLPGAQAIYRRIVAAHPDDALGWAAYGEFLRFLIHDPVAAKQAFQSALAVPHPSDQLRALALKGLGDLAAAAGDSEGAIALMRQSLQVASLADTHRALGVLLLVARHDEAGAAEEARLAVAATPNDPLSLLVYAILLERIGHHEDGRRAFDQALAIAGCDQDGQANHPVHCCVFYNAACYFSVCRQRTRSLTMLRAFFNAPNHLHRSRQDIEHDPDFAGMLQDPGFIALLDRNLPPQAGAPTPR